MNFLQQMDGKINLRCNTLQSYGIIMGIEMCKTEGGWTWVNLWGSLCLRGWFLNIPRASASFQDSRIPKVFNSG